MKGIFFFPLKKKKFRWFRAGTSQGHAPRPPKQGLIRGLSPVFTAGSAGNTGPRAGAVLPPGGHLGDVWRHFGVHKGQEMGVGGVWRGGQAPVLPGLRISTRLALDSKGQQRQGEKKHPRCRVSSTPPPAASASSLPTSHIRPRALVLTLMGKEAIPNAWRLVEH